MALFAGLNALLVVAVAAWMAYDVPGLGVIGECEDQPVPASAEILDDFPFECGLNELKSAAPKTLRVFAYVTTSLPTRIPVLRLFVSMSDVRDQEERERGGQMMGKPTQPTVLTARPPPTRLFVCVCVCV